MVYNSNNYAGWWLTYPSEKYEFVSWDYNWYNSGHNCGTIQDAED